MPTVEQLREIIGGDATSLAELERLMDANDGELTPDIVLAAALPESSALHQHFEWDDTIAAHAWRKAQARQLIRSYELHIVDNEGERKTRYFTNVIIDDEHRYMRTEEVLRVESLREQRRIQLLRELNRVKGDLSTFDEFAPAAAEVEQAIAALQSVAPTGAQKKR